MYCKNCGKEIEDDSKYCRNCGSEFSGDITQSPGFVSNQVKKKITIAAAIVIALLIAAVSFILFFTIDESPNSKVNNFSHYKNLS